LSVEYFLIREGVLLIDAVDKGNKYFSEEVLV
jgi:hypothetical protein